MVALIEISKGRPNYTHKKYNLSQRTLQHPVDVVITWVNFSDVNWREKYREAYKNTNGSFPHISDEIEQFDDKNTELYYNVQLLQKYLPWVSTIYIFTQRPQTVSWIDEFENVKIVHHDEAFEGETFNGMMTIARVSNIPQLSEHYIQFDDDMFVITPLSPTYFFSPNEKPVIRPQVDVIYNISENKHYGKIKNNTRALLKKYTGKRFLTVWRLRHQPMACRKSMVLEAQKTIPENEWKKIGLTRSDTDFEFFDMYLTDYFIRKKRNEIEIGKGNGLFIEGNVVSEHFETSCDIVCFNNEFTENVKKFLKSRLK